MHLSIKNKLAYPITLFILWRLAIFLFQVFLQPLHWSVPSGDVSNITDRVITLWAYKWDAVHYLHIAQHGYDTFSYQAFFPLWPIVLRVFLGFGFSPPIAVVFLTTIFGLVIFCLFYLLAAIIFDERHARKALLLFCVFPSTFFLNAGYTEGLYIALTLLSFYLIERKKFMTASIIAAFAGVTRFVGISMIPSFMGLKTTLVKRIQYLLIFLTGLTLHMTYLFVMYHDPFAYLTANMGWCKKVSFPFMGFVTSMNSEFSNILRLNISDATASVVYAVVFFIVFFLGFRKLPPIYRYYTLSALVLPLVTYCTPSMTRHILAAFPIFFILPFFIKNRFIFWALAGSMFIIQLLDIAKFMHGYFIG